MSSSLLMKERDFAIILCGIRMVNDNGFWFILERKRLVMNRKNETKRGLTLLQFYVTKECGTEPPFQNVLE
jgi:hypothetical protein